MKHQWTNMLRIQQLFLLHPFWAVISESNKLILDLLQYTTIDWILRTRSESGTNTNSANTNTNTNTYTNTNSNVNVDHLKIASLRCRLTRRKET